MISHGYKKSIYIIIILATSLIVSPSYARVIKIDQASALAGGVTPGDAPGFPVTISQPGAYKLNSNLDVTVSANPANTTAIEVTSDHVKINLSGFSIISSGVPGSGRGIDGVTSQSRFTTVTNGSIKGVGNNGIDLFENSNIQNVRVENVEGHGVVIHGGSRVSNSIIDLGGALGSAHGIITFGFGFKIENNIIHNAGQSGIGHAPTISGGSALVIGNVVRNSGGVGINVDVNSILIDNLVE